MAVLGGATAGAPWRFGMECERAGGPSTAERLLWYGLALRFALVLAALASRLSSPLLPAAARCPCCVLPGAWCLRRSEINFD